MRNDVDEIRIRDEANTRAKNETLAWWRDEYYYKDDVSPDGQLDDVKKTLDALAEDATPLDVKLAHARAKNDTLAVVFCTKLQAILGDKQGA